MSPERERSKRRPGLARAVYFVGPGSVELRAEQLRPEPGEVLVHSRLMAISHGTEMLAFRGRMPRELAADETLAGLGGSLAYPLKYGYANAGVSERGRRVFAFYPHQDRFFFPSQALIPLPEALSFEDAVFLPNMETALGIVHDTNPRLGETVLVVGQGVVGLLTAELLVRSGIGLLISVEPLARRRAASSGLGCLAVEPGPGVKETVMERTGGRGVDAAVNLSASGEGLQLALDCLAREGTVVEASWYGSAPVTLNLGAAFHRRRLRVRSSQVSRLDPSLGERWDKPRRLAAVLAFLEELHPSRYITHRFPLQRAEEAYALIDANPQACIQVVLEP